MDGLPDWITAAATAATAIAAFAAALIAFLGYKRDARMRLPIIEPSFEAYGGSSAFVNFQLVVRNRLDESLTVTSVRLLRPKGTTFTSPVPSHNSLMSSGKYKSDGKTERSIDLKIAPHGSINESPLAQRVGANHIDVGSRNFHLAMPSGWDGKLIEFELRVSSAALTIRDKRIVVKRHVNAAPNTQIEAKASSHD